MQDSAPGVQVTLHLGAHRTSTTRAQAIMARAQSTGRLQHTFYAGPNDVRQIAGLAAVVIDRAPVTARLAAPWMLRRAIPPLVAAISAKTQAVVISEETLLGVIDRSVLKGEGLYPEAGLRVRALRRLLRGVDVRPVIAIRSYAEWFASAYATVVRRRPLPEPSKLAAEWARLPRGWPEIVAEIVAAFGRCDVVRFEDLRWDKEIMLRALTPDEVDRLPRNRVRFFPSMSAAAIRELAIWRAAKRKFDTAALNAMIERHRGTPGLKPFAEADREALDARYAADMERLTALGGQFVEPVNTQVGRGRTAGR